MHARMQCMRVRGFMLVHVGCLEGRHAASLCTILKKVSGVQLQSMFSEAETMRRLRLCQPITQAPDAIPSTFRIAGAYQAWTQEPV